MDEQTQITPVKKAWLTPDLALISKNTIEFKQVSDSESGIHYGTAS